MNTLYTPTFTETVVDELKISANCDTPKAELIRASSIGDEFNDKECEILASLMIARHLTDGETLVHEGENDYHLFLLAEGELAVISNVAGHQTTVHIMTQGECAGTRAFVDRTPRRATLKAIGATTVYTLEPQAFEAQLEAHPRLVFKMMRALFRSTHTNLMRMNLERDQLNNYITKSFGRY